ncbi:MAG: hypothetical protein WAM71_07800 [Candidatus Korobacteraceae bacterium]
MFRLGRFFAGAIAVLLIVVAAFFLLYTRFVFSTIGYATNQIASRSGVSPFLVRGILIFATIPFFWAVSVFSRNFIGFLNLGWNPLSFYKKSAGIVIVLYIGMFYCAMYWASLKAYAYKYCADTPEGIFTSDATGKDPVYGIELAPCTVEQAKAIRNGEGMLPAPQERHVENVDAFVWFDGVTGKPRIWYSLPTNGVYTFFDRPGNDPYSGQVLQPVTPELVQNLRRQQAAQRDAEQKKHADQAVEEQRKNAAEVASAANAKEAADLKALSAEAESQFDAGNYKTAKQTCDQVLARATRMEPCLTLRHRASVKLAQVFVERGLTQFQKGEFDEAQWSADEAIRLDSSNATAIRLKQLTAQVKPRAVN